MGLIGIIGDTHYGIRNDESRFLVTNKKFFQNVFFPTLRKEKVKTVIHLGDLVERRKYLSVIVGKSLREDFLDPVLKDYDYHHILGNHDTYSDESNKISVVREYYPYLNIYDEATEVNIEGKPMLFVPWISKEIVKATHQTIVHSNARVVMGHLELRNFEMHYSGSQKNESGDDPERYYKFEDVFSGHFHHQSRIDNIRYLGAHGEFTWNDHDDPRGFHLYDTDTRKLTFIPNPYHMFTRIHFYQGMDVPDVENQYVEVFVKTGHNPDELKIFINDLHERQPIDVKIEYEIDGFITEVDTFDMDGRNALELMKTEITDTEASINKIKTLQIAENLYRKSQDKFYETLV